METTKTLTPTNQAITLAAFTEKPDNRTNVTNDDKLADAVNALNSKLTNLPDVSYASISGTSLSDFEASIDSALVNMNTGDIRVCPAIANYSQSLTAGGQAVAFLSKTSTTVWWCFLVYTAGVKAGYKTSGAWTWL